MTKELLLLETVEGLGKKGEIITKLPKPGYIRNFLMPKLRRNPGDKEKKSLVMAIADSKANKIKALIDALDKERKEEEKHELKQANEMAAAIAPLVLEKKEKVDPDGRMYGSVTAANIAQLFVDLGIPVERRFVQLLKPIKETGMHEITLKLKQGVTVSCKINIIPDGIVRAPHMEAVVKPLPVEGEAPSTTEEPTE